MEPDYQPTPVESGIGGTPPSPKSIWSIIGNVFMAPTQAFADYVVKPTILIPIILTVILGGTVGGFKAPYDAQLKYQMMKSSTVLRAGDIQKMKDDIDNPNLVMSILGGAITPVVLSALAALVVLFFGRFVFGGEGGFMAAWGVGMLAWLIPTLGELLRLPLMFAKDTVLVSYGLAALMPGKDFTTLAYATAYYLDIWEVWSIVVAGFGYAAVFGLSRNKGITISVMKSALAITLFLLSLLGMSFAGVEVSWF